VKRSQLRDKTSDDPHRVTASTAPRNSRVPGSPEWCYQTMNLLKDSYRHIHADQGRFTHYLSELREHRAWEKIPVDHPYGTESKMLVTELGKRVEEIEVELDAAKQAQLAAKNRDLNETTPDLKEPHRPEKSRDNNNDTRVSTGGESDTAAYAIAKLRKDRPDIHARVLAGELSPNAGMVEAGFRKKRASRKLTAFQRIVKLLPKLTNDERKKLHRMLT
jgi:hypothetical protein